jgi:hypothetical protein
MSPSSGTSYVGRQYVFEATYYVVNDWRNLKFTSILLRSSNGKPTVTLMYNQNTNTMYLRAPDGSARFGGYALGAGAPIVATHARFYVGASSVYGSGNLLRVRWAVTFRSPTDSGSYHNYISSSDDAGVRVGLKWVGTRQVR